MTTVLMYVLIGFLVLLGLTLLTGSILLVFFNTDAIAQRQLKRQAKEDYRQARGTAHRQLLEKAASNINHQIKDYQKRKDEAEAENHRLIKAKNAELDQVLTRWLVEKRLQEVRGVGEVLTQQIVRRVFRGSLSDLRRAHLIDGIGPQKQWQINQWVQRYEAQIPQLRTQNFPGKQRIEFKYRTLIEKQEKIMQQATSEQEKLKRRLQPINEELKWLRSVNPKLFVQAYKRSDEDRPEINRYLQGVFAEWEPMPDWFQAEVSSEVG